MNLPAIIPPNQQLVKHIGPAVQDWFLEKFQKPIHVYAASTPDGVTYRFQMTKPGLLATKFEQDAFEGYIAGYRAAASFALTLYEPEGETN